MGLRVLEQSIRFKHNIWSVAILGASLGAFALLYPQAGNAQDDWEMVGTDSAAEASSPAAGPPSAPAEAAPASTRAKSFTACGERVTAADARIQDIVDRIDELWGTNFPVYETIAAEQPHAGPGGCILYNSAALATILVYRLDVNDKSSVDPIVWAVFAHEIGHQVHQDNEKSRRWVPSETKELEADRFAGYTLEKLQIPATDLTAFWNLTGDEFGGGQVSTRNQHGLSSQRVAAFKQGWHLAEWKRAENSDSVAAAQEEAVAPDSPDAAPK